MRRLIPFIALAAGCAGTLNVNVPVTAMQDAPSTGATASRADTTIAAKPIAYQDLDANRGLLVKLGWREAHASQVRDGSSGAGTLVYGMVPKLPIPTFAVHVSNKSGQPLDFANADIALVDGQGKRWPIFKDKGELSGRVWSDAVIRYPNLTGQEDQQEQLTNFVQTTPMLDHHATLAAGSDFDGFIAFKLDARAPNELEKFLAASGKLTIEIKNVGPDGASFTLPITLGKAQLAAACPDNKPQVIQNCEAQPLKE